MHRLKQGFCNDSVYVEISSDAVTCSTWLTSGVLWVHTGPALRENRSAPPPTALTPASSTSGNPHTLRICLILFYLLLIYHLLQASPPASRIHFSARLTYHIARTQ